MGKKVAVFAHQIFVAAIIKDTIQFEGFCPIEVKMTKATNVIKSQIMTMIEAGKKQVDIANELGISEATIRRVLLQKDPTKKARIAGRHGQAQLAAVLRKQGKSFSEIASATGLSRKTAKKRLITVAPQSFNEFSAAYMLAKAKQMSIELFSAPEFSSWSAAKREQLIVQDVEKNLQFLKGNAEWSRAITKMYNEAATVADQHNALHAAANRRLEISRTLCVNCREGTCGIKCPKELLVTNQMESDERCRKLVKEIENKRNASVATTN